jgi:hypothetical protein
MSWAAHDLEPYLLRVKLGAKLSMPFCLFGSYSPDVFTKWLVYGWGFTNHHRIVNDPIQFHRGWPGVGFTHSPAYGCLVAGIIYAASKNRMWALSYLLGAIAHDASDTLDSVGVMMLFPLSTWHLHLNLWEYVGEVGRAHDAVAYYTSLGGVWDAFWVVWLLRHWRTLTAIHFREHIFPTDPFWPKLQRRVGATLTITFYRGSAFFGVTSVIGWYIWALAVNRFHPHLDWSPGGPGWAPRVGPR